MSDSVNEMILWVSIAATTLYAYLAWRLRPFGRNPEGRPGGFTGTLAMSIATWHLALGQKVFLAGGTLPRWASLTFLLAVLVAYRSLFWTHVEELRARWRDRLESPDPARFPTYRWKWTARLATVLNITLLILYVQSPNPYTGFMGPIVTLVAVYAWGDWMWRRWELSVIRRIQARQETSPAAGQEARVV